MLFMTNTLVLLLLIVCGKTTVVKFLTDVQNEIISSWEKMTAIEVEYI